MPTRSHLLSVSLTALSLVCGVIVCGCDRKETVLDVDTPGGGGVDVERNIDTGAVTVDVDDAN